MANENQAEAPKEEGPRSFAVLIRDMADGECEAEASSQLYQLGRLLQEQALLQQDTVTGRITLSIDISVDQKGVADLMFKVDTKNPKKKHAGAVFFMTKDGNLSREAPKQLGLKLRDVSAAPTAEARDVAGAATTGTGGV